MRHHKKTRIFNRPKAARDALQRSLAISLLKHESITTTLAKAKSLRPFVEKLVSTGKIDSLAARRQVATTLHSATAAKKLHDDFAKRYNSRSGGYTRIVRLGRVGKRVAEMAKIEFV